MHPLSPGIEIMAAETQKVVHTREDNSGTQEMSAARLVDTITGMLLQLPAPQRLEVLRQVEARVKPAASEGEIVRKVNRSGRAFAISMPVRFSEIQGEYIVKIVEGKRIVYEQSGKGDVRIRKLGTAIRIPLPKWAYEAIGSPSYVRVRIEDDKIVVEPAA